NQKGQNGAAKVWHNRARWLPDDSTWKCPSKWLQSSFCVQVFQGRVAANGQILQCLLKGSGFHAQVWLLSHPAPAAFLPGLNWFATFVVLPALCTAEECLYRAQMPLTPLLLFLH